MILFRLVSWPYLRKHALRSALTLFGIVIGVAVFVSMRVANQAVLSAFQQTVSRIAGATQLQISAGEPGMDEDVLERVQSLPEVKVAVPVTEAVAGTRLPGQGNLLILGVDMTGDRSLRDYHLDGGDAAAIDDPLIFLAQPDSLMVTSQFAARNQLRLNSRVPLETAAGVKDFVVRGVLQSGGLNAAFGGNLAIMDVYAAQHVFGRGRKFDRIDLAVADGVEVSAARHAIQTLLGPGFEVEPPLTRGQSMESMLEVYRFMLTFSSAFAVVIGMFVIYNSLAISVTQRRAEIGTLRALGATRRQIQNLFLGEGVVAGLVGSVLGLFLGTLGAGAVAASLSALLEGVYGVPRAPVPVAVTPLMGALAVLVGVTTCMLAGLLPARSAARVDPVKALQKGTVQLPSERENRVRLYLAAGLAIVCLALMAMARSLSTVYSAWAGVTAVALLLTPWLALWLARGLRPLLRRVRPVEGALAADSLIGAPRRTSATVAALMCSLGLVVCLEGSARSAYANISNWVDDVLNPDLFVTPSQTLVVRTYKFPESMAAELKALPGIEQVHMIRTAFVNFRGERTSLIALEMDLQAARTRRVAVEGDLDRMYSIAAAGQGVIVSEIFSARRNVHLGQPLDIASPRGILKLPVVGVVREYADQRGSAMVSRAVYKQWWNDDSVDVFRVYLQRGASAAAVKESILQRFASNRRLFVLMNSEVRSYVLRTTDQWFKVTWIQIAVALLVAILGIVNSLTVSITDRRRELAVLQAVGGLRRQLRATIWMEALSVGVIGIVLGLGLGAVYLYFFLQMTALGGMQFEYLYPASLGALLFPIILSVAFLSSIGPAETALRSPLVEGLEYE